MPHDTKLNKEYLDRQGVEEEKKSRSLSQQEHVWGLQGKILKSQKNVHYTNYTAL